MIVKLLTEHYLEFLSLKGGCTGSYESTLVKIPHCRKSHVAAHIVSIFSDLLRNIRTQVLIKLIKPYTRIHIPFISKVSVIIQMFSVATEKPV